MHCGKHCTDDQLTARMDHSVNEQDQVVHLYSKMVRNIVTSRKLLEVSIHAQVLDKANVATFHVNTLNLIKLSFPCVLIITHTKSIIHHLDHLITVVWPSRHTFDCHSISQARNIEVLSILNRKHKCKDSLHDIMLASSNVAFHTNIHLVSIDMPATN